MSRYRLYPSGEQETLLLGHCGHARYVWNLAVEQLGWSRHGRWCPTFAEQCRQLTDARAEHEWLRAGSQTVQQQALRDFNQAVANWRGGTHRRPTWRKQGRHAFAAIPEPIAGPCDGSVVGIDRGVAVSLACSDGTMHQAPAPLPITRAARALSRCRRGSNRRKKAKSRLARLHARNADRRKDWAEKASTDIANRYDVIRIEDLKVRNMTRSARGTVETPGRNVRQKAGLNRSILAAGWSLFAHRLEHKATGRVEKVNPAYTSQCCSVCGHVARESRESQALFRCVACGHTSNADLNAARNIAAGRATRGADGLPTALNREPQHSPSLVA